MPLSDLSDAELLEAIADKYDQIATVAKNLYQLAKGGGLPTNVRAREELMDSNMKFMVFLQGHAADLGLERERRRRPSR
jgi:hypothetical protein